MYALVWVCAPNYNIGKMRYCCGNADCCKGKDVRERDLATDVFRPPQATLSSSSTSSASASGGTNQPTHDGSNNSSNNSSSSGGGGGGNINSHALAIGLGVGIPMCLALLGGIIFLGLQVRKWAAAAAAKQTDGSTGDGGNNGPREGNRDVNANFFVQRQELHAVPIGLQS